MKVYTDGSFSEEIGKWAFIVIDTTDQIVHKAAGISDAPGRNIGAELMAVIKAILYMEDKYTNIEYCIYYDYMGIELWYNNTWKAKTPNTREYVEFVSLRKLLFKKVKSHSGDKYNSMVDALCNSVNVKTGSVL